VAGPIRSLNESILSDLPIDHIRAVLIKTKYIDVLLSILLSVVSFIVISVLRQNHLSVQNTDFASNSGIMGKKQKKVAGVIDSPAAPQLIVNSKKGLISDTTCAGLARTTWQGTYDLLEAEKPEQVVEEATADSTKKSECTLKDLADSFLHRIAAREQMLPYTDVIKWAIEEIPITDRTFVAKDGRIFGSFKPEDLRQMYHLPMPEKVYNSAFLEKFASENEIESEPIKDWRQNPSKHKHESSGKYSVDSLCSPYCYAAIMMCRLWGLHDSAIFTIEMVPLMEAAVNSWIMDWATILSDKLALAVSEFRNQTRVSERIIPPFYYSAYILDTLCFNSEFPILGWRWTTQDPSPIHIYHRKMWKSSHKNHLYHICNGFMIPIYYAIFNKPIPRISYLASFDLPSVGSWFGEEYFTYVRVYGSQANPHVLPLYVPDKLLAREIAYQLSAKSTTQTLRLKQKRGWPTFPFRCGVFTLHDLKHAEKEAMKIQALNLPIIPNRAYDPRKYAYAALEHAKLSTFEHKEDIFDDIFVSAESIGHAKELARTRYNDVGLSEFNKLREQRLQTLPLDLIMPTQAASSSEPGKQRQKEPPATLKTKANEQEEQQKKEQAERLAKEKEELLKREQAERLRKEEEDRLRKEQEDNQRKKQAEIQQKEHERQEKEKQEQLLKESQSKQNTTDTNKGAVTDPELQKEWQHFSTIIGGGKDSQNTETPKSSGIQKEGSSQALSTTTGPPKVMNVEIIPKGPSDQITLLVEDIPPLNVFYSPKHKAVVKRSRKRQRIDQPSLFPEQSLTGNVVWREKLDPSDDLAKLSQYAGAYSAATIDKASEVAVLLKTKDQEIFTLQTELADVRQRVIQAEQQLAGHQQETVRASEQLLEQQKINSQLVQQWQEEKQRITQAAIQRQSELTEVLEQLKAANEQSLKAKDERIAQITAQLEATKGDAQIQEFKKEAMIINKALVSQVKLLAQSLSQAEPLCELATTVSEQVEKAREEYNQAEEDITSYIEWQDSKSGKEANLPRILEVHKNILFTEWQTQILKAERAASRCTLTAGNLADLVNDTLYLANIVSQCTPGKITTANALEQTCYPDLEGRARSITAVDTLNIEAYWRFLIKPHEQRSALKCLTDAVQCMIPDIQDSTYAAQLSSRLNKPPEVEPMLAINQLRFKGKQPTE